MTDGGGVSVSSFDCGLLYGLNSAHLDSAAPPFRKPDNFRRMMDNNIDATAISEDKHGDP
jgi:hypothetical protein